MPNVRSLNKERYGISKHKFAEVYHFCLQYNEWKDELMYKTETVKSVEISDTPMSHTVGHATEDLALRRVELRRKCELVEQTALEADGDIYKYILKAVTNENVSYNYLRTVMGIPCGHNYYYTKRRRFYWLMSSKL